MDAPITAAAMDIAAALGRCAHDDCFEAHGSFRERALRCLRERLSCDAALWAAGHLEPDGPEVTASRLLDRPAAMLADHAALLGEDPLARACVRSVGAACVLNRQPDRIGVSKAWLDFVARWQLVHAMGCFLADPVTGLFSGVALWRERAEAPFTERERALFEAVVPHLAAEWDRVRLARATRSWHVPDDCAHALSDGDGRLRVAPARFQKLLRTEFPRWSGARLPAPLLPLVAQPGRHEGERCIVTTAPGDRLCLVEVCARPDADDIAEAA